MLLSKVKLEKNELWPYYKVYRGKYTPDFHVEIPEELWNRYETTLHEFLDALAKLKVFLKDD